MKRGEIEINRLIALALGAIVLVILLLVFSQGARDFAGKLFGISDEANVSGDKCVNAFSFQQCYSKPCAEVTREQRNSDPNALYTQVIAPSGTFSDCRGTGQYCCRRER